MPAAPHCAATGSGWGFSSSNSFRASTLPAISPFRRASPAAPHGGVASGGARATKPLVLLADEPTGNLDEATADDVLGLARDLVKRTGCGFLMVTHSARLAATLDRQVNLHAGLIA